MGNKGQQVPNQCGLIVQLGQAKDWTRAGLVCHGHWT